jgi:hypothetical protein
MEIHYPDYRVTLNQSTKASQSHSHCFDCHMYARDAVDGSSTRTEVLWMWILLSSVSRTRFFKFTELTRPVRDGERDHEWVRKQVVGRYQPN